MSRSSHPFKTWHEAIDSWSKSPFDFEALKEAFAAANVSFPQALLDLEIPSFEQFADRWPFTPHESDVAAEPVDEEAETEPEPDTEAAPADPVEGAADTPAVPFATDESDAVDAIDAILPDVPAIEPELAAVPEAGAELAATASSEEPMMMQVDAASASGLRWAPPTLKPGYTVIDLNKTGSQTYWEFRPDEDVLFIASDSVRSAHRLQTSGGNNIVLVGGEYVPTSKATATLYFTNLHGSVHVEGVHINNKNVAQDGIAVYGASGKSPTVTIQNSLIENVNGTRSGTHGDVFQTHGPVGDIRMYNVTGSTNYQGLFIAPQAPTKSATLENVNMRYIPGGDSTTYQYWFLDNANEKPFPISLKNVYTTERSGQSAEYSSVWPKAGLSSIGAVRSGDDITWPGLPYDGKVTVGMPPVGDFVKAAEVGLNYDGAIGVDPAPVEPAPTEPAPTEPAPTDPAPTDPAPTEPTPAAPADSGAPTNWIAGDDKDNVLTGTSGNDQISGRQGDDTMSGGKGDDTYIVGQAGDKVIEKAGEGVDTVVSHIDAYTLPDNVENLKLEGTGNSSGTGNGLANKITGNAGANVLDGKGGNDWLAGGAGNDTFVIAKGESNDTVADFAKGDKVQLTGFAFANFAALQAAMSQSGANVVVDLGDGQTLTLLNVQLGALTAEDFDLGAAPTPPAPTEPAPTEPAPTEPAPTDPAPTEPTPAAPADSGAPTNWIAGDDKDNVLTGTDRNDQISGRQGDDTMSGGKGDDTYIVGQAGDKVIEKAGEGVDTVVSHIDAYTLPDNVENLKLEGTGNSSGTGNGLANKITGNAGANVLDGKGGNDWLAGGAGNDTFVIAKGEGNDTVADFAKGDKVQLTGFAFQDFAVLQAAMSQSGANVVVDLGDGQSLTLLNVQLGSLAAEDFGLGGTPSTPPAEPPAQTPDPSFFELPLSGEIGNWIRGDNANDTLTGTDGNDFVNGKGGIDVMSGGKGDDTYIVSTTADQVVEKPGEGVDTVASWASTYSLPPNVENLWLENWGDQTGIGNELDNLLVARYGDNSLSGMGGNDILVAGIGTTRMTGGEGNDIFAIRSMAEKGAVVTDFDPAKDLLDLRGLVPAAQLEADPEVSHYVSLAAQGEATVVKVDPTGKGAGEIVATLEGIQPTDLADAMHNWL